MSPFLVFKTGKRTRSGYALESQGDSESVVQAFHSWLAYRAYVVRQVAFSEAEKVVTHDPTGMLQSLFDADWNLG